VLAGSGFGYEPFLAISWPAGLTYGVVYLVASGLALALKLQVYLFPPLIFLSGFQRSTEEWDGRKVAKHIANSF
jgi:hypothetical protein